MHNNYQSSSVNSVFCNVAATVIIQKTSKTNRLWTVSIQNYPNYCRTSCNDSSTLPVVLFSGMVVVIPPCARCSGLSCLLQKYGHLLNHHKFLTNLHSCARSKCIIYVCIIICCTLFPSPPERPRAFYCLFLISFFLSSWTPWIIISFTFCINTLGGNSLYWLGRNTLQEWFYVNYSLEWHNEMRLRHCALTWKLIQHPST